MRDNVRDQQARQLQSFLFHQLLKLLHQIILNFLQAEHAYFLNL